MIDIKISNARIMGVQGNYIVRFYTEPIRAWAPKLKKFETKPRAKETYHATMAQCMNRMVRHLQEQTDRHLKTVEDLEGLKIWIEHLDGMVSTMVQEINTKMGLSVKNNYPEWTTATHPVPKHVSAS